jgi:hypothetical protein
MVGAPLHQHFPQELLRQEVALARAPTLVELVEQVELILSLQAVPLFRCLIFLGPRDRLAVEI